MDSRLPFQRKRKVREDKKPACDACRSHKLRCDASLDYSRPCTRCRRKQIFCVVQEQRRKKTFSDEAQKTPSLAAQHPIGIVSQSSSLAKDAIPLPQTTFVEEAKEAFMPLLPAFANGFSDIEPQTIGDVHVEAAKIDICFTRFFRYFAPLIPILSTQSSPGQTFRESPLKFWVITAIGSRKCLEDPTLFTTLSSHVETLALQSLCVGRLSPYPIVEAYLLMCNFHLSTDRPSWRSIYFTLSSAAVSVALQAGMHHCLSAQSVFTSNANPEVERSMRLWAYAVVLNQTITLLQGFPVTDTISTRHLLWQRDCCTNLPHWLVIEARIVAHVAGFHQIVSDLEPSGGLMDYSRVLKSRISASEAELCGLQSSVQLGDQGPLSALYIAIAQLQIRSFTFLASPAELDHVDIVQLADAAIATINLVLDIDQRLQITLACPEPVFQGIQLAACTLLKLLKSYPSKTSFIEKNMTNALFSAINVAKLISAANNDIPAKLSEILSQLWSSPNVYRDADGGHTFALQVRNRLAMNVVFDCLYWWRKLFLRPFTAPPPQAENPEALDLIFSGQGADENVEPSQLLFDGWGSWGFDWDCPEALQLSVPRSN